MYGIPYLYLIIYKVTINKYDLNFSIIIIDLLLWTIVLIDHLWSIISYK